MGVEYLNNRIDTNKEEMTIDIKILLDTYKNIDKQSLKSQILGKTQAEIKNIVFINFSTIEKIKVKFWPFWIRKTSSNLNKINIDRYRGLT